MDRLTIQHRSWLMSQIRSRNTKPELAVRRALHALGYRYHLDVSALPGKPDLVFPSRKKIIFVHGCYWHAHTCRFGRSQSKSNVDFWVEKLRSNVARDRRVINELKQLGWEVHVIWECEVKADTWLLDALIFIEGGADPAPLDSGSTFRIRQRRVV